MKRWKTALLSPAFQYPLFAMIILIAISVWYYRFAVKRSEGEVNERSLLVLAALAEEFSSRLATLEQITRGNWDPKELRTRELREQVPGLEGDECPNTLTEPPHTKLSESGYKLHLVVGGIVDSNKAGEHADKLWLHSCWAVSYEGLMRSLEESLPKGVFEDLLLTNADGRVLYQTHRSGMKVADLHPFFDESDTGERRVKGQQGESASAAADKGGKKPREEIQNDHKHQPNGTEQRFSELLATSRLTDVELGGEHYKLYSVPVPIPVLMNPSHPFTFIVGGILHERTFQAERTNPLLNTLVTIGFFVLLGTVAIYPILRFRLMGSAEVLKERTGFVFVLQILLTTVLLGGLLGHLIFSHSTQKTDDQLKELAKTIEKNFAEETGAALDMLGALENFYLAKHPVVGISKVAGDCLDEVSPQRLAGLKLPANDFHWTGEILKQFPKPVYPYFDNAFFVDGAGAQEIKFSTRTSVTPEVRVCDSEAFSHTLRPNDLWRLSNRAGSFWIEPMYSKTSGRYLAFISRVSADRLRAKVPVAVIGTELISVSQPVLPPDYGFAIVDRDGGVLFHSTPAKNRRENFADACGRNRRLTDLFETRGSDTLETQYLGIQHRIFVQPITKLQDCPWSVVVFRDLTNLEEDHFDSFLMFCMLTGAYIILAILLAWVAGFAKRPPSWIWPTQDDRPIYGRLFLVLGLVTGLNIWLLFYCDETELWLSAFTIPLAAVVFTIFRLRSQDRIILFAAAALWLIATLWAILHHASLPFWLLSTALCIAFACLALPLEWGRFRVGHRSLATAYALPAIVLLFTIGFIPAIRLFNASVLFQDIVAARRSQLELTEMLDRRRERINSAYGDSDEIRKQRLYREIRDRYDLDPKRSFPDPKSNSFQPQHLDPLLKSIASNFLMQIHSGSSPRHGLGLPTTPPAREWCEHEGTFPKGTLLLRIAEGGSPCIDPKNEPIGDYHNRWIVSDLPRQAILGFGANPFVFFEMLTIIVMLTSGFFGLRYAIKRLFVLDWKRPAPWRGVRISRSLNFKDEPFTRHSILLGVPLSSKTEEIRQCSNLHYIDLIGYSQATQETAPFGPDEVAGLDHFEHDLDNPLQRNRKLRVLERFVFEAKCRVVIVSNIDPLYYFLQLAKRERKAEDEGNESLEIERWTKVLADFRIVRAENRSSIQGDQYFALLWQTCSMEERAALHQIAKYGWANCHQQPALAHLFQRGLVSHDRSFFIADPDFSDYICRSFGEERFIAPEESGSADALSVLRVLLVFAGVAFIGALAYIWGDQMVAYVATGASAVTAATRAFARSRGRGPLGGGVAEV